MCNCNLPTGAVCVRSSCRECIRRAHEGPNYDPRRGTGRTSHAVKAAVMAAAFGQRVVYICGNQASADYANSVAREFVEQSLGKVCEQRVWMSKERITFHFANGAVAGILVFRSIAAQDINLGMRKEQVFRVIEDHWATQVREAAAQRLADSNEIKRLMRKNGWAEATDCRADPTNPRVDKLVFRT